MGFTWNSDPAGRVRTADWSEIRSRITELEDGISISRTSYSHPITDKILPAAILEMKQAVDRIHANNKCRTHNSTYYSTNRSSPHYESHNTTFHSSAYDSTHYSSTHRSTHHEQHNSSYYASYNGAPYHTSTHRSNHDSNHNSSHNSSSHYSGHNSSSHRSSHDSSYYSGHNSTHRGTHNYSHRVSHDNSHNSSHDGTYNSGYKRTDNSSNRGSGHNYSNLVSSFNGTHDGIYY